MKTSKTIALATLLAACTAVGAASVVACSSDDSSAPAGDGGSGIDATTDACTGSTCGEVQDDSGIPPFDAAPSGPFGICYECLAGESAPVICMSAVTPSQCSTYNGSGCSGACEPHWYPADAGACSTHFSCASAGGDSGTLHDAGHGDGAASDASNDAGAGDAADATAEDASDAASE